VFVPAIGLAAAFLDAASTSASAGAGRTEFLGQDRVANVVTPSPTDHQVARRGALAPEAEPLDERDGQPLRSHDRNATR
jgi:hypothetical protein